MSLLDGLKDSMKNPLAENNSDMEFVLESDFELALEKATDVKLSPEDIRAILNGDDDIDDEEDDLDNPGDDVDKDYTSELEACKEALEATMTELGIDTAGDELDEDDDLDDPELDPEGEDELLSEEALIATIESIDLDPEEANLIAQCEAMLEGEIAEEDATTFIKKVGNHGLNIAHQLKRRGMIEARKVASQAANNIRNNTKNSSISKATEFSDPSSDEDDEPPADDSAMESPDYLIGKDKNIHVHSISESDDEIEDDNFEDYESEDDCKKKHHHEECDDDEECEKKHHDDEDEDEDESDEDEDEKKDKKEKEDDDDEDEEEAEESTLESILDNLLNI